MYITVVPARLYPKNLIVQAQFPKIVELMRIQCTVINHYKFWVTKVLVSDHFWHEKWLMYIILPAFTLATVQLQLMIIIIQ